MVVLMLCWCEFDGMLRLLMQFQKPFPIENSIALDVWTRVQVNAMGRMEMLRCLRCRFEIHLAFRAFDTVLRTQIGSRFSDTFIAAAATAIAAAAVGAIVGCRITIR